MTTPAMALTMVEITMMFSMLQRTSLPDRVRRIACSWNTGRSIICIISGVSSQRGQYGKRKE